MAYLRQCLLELRALERHATTIDFVDAPVTGAAAALYALRATSGAAAVEPDAHAPALPGSRLAAPIKA